jgi:hypothetical protein
MEPTAINSLFAGIATVIGLILGYLRWRDEKRHEERVKAIENALLIAENRIKENEREIEKQNIIIQAQTNEIKLQKEEIRALTSDNVKYREENAGLKASVEMLERMLANWSVTKIA